MPWPSLRLMTRDILTDFHNHPKGKGSFRVTNILTRHVEITCLIKSLSPTVQNSDMLCYIIANSQCSLHFRLRVWFKIFCRRHRHHSSVITFQTSKAVVNFEPKWGIHPSDKLWTVTNVARGLSNLRICSLLYQHSWRMKASVYISVYHKATRIPGKYHHHILFWRQCRVKRIYASDFSDFRGSQWIPVYCIELKSSFFIPCTESCLPEGRANG